MLPYSHMTPSAAPAWIPQPAPVADLDPVWRALADPTRRALLDLLRARPRTTGELADRFPLSRFAIMKHLGVLVEAGLVLVVRQGRERWNHLNPIPFRQVHDRYLRPFEEASADRLLRLKGVAEQLEQEAAMATAAADRAFRTIDIRHEVVIKAAPARVWAALTAEIARWWPAKFYVGKAPVRFALEPWVGGRVFEDWGDGEGAIWGMVSTVRKDESLQWTADLPADYGGPARGITSFELVAEQGGTRLRFRDSMYGELSAKMQEQLGQGWAYLLQQCFAPYVEEGKQPERPATVE